MGQLFAGKVAIVTGAGSGIGEATAILYAENGAKVIVSDVNEAHGNTVVEKIKSKGGEAAFVKCDVSHAAECQKLVEETLKIFGRLDMACNNAGIGGEANLIADYSIENFDKVIAINLSSVFYCMKYQIPAMLKTGGGAIVNMASILGKVGFANSVAYVAAKHGVVGLTENAGIEYASKGIRVNAVGPGFINTPLLENTNPAQKAGLVALHPMGRLGKAEEVAELVIWLSSDKASFMAGAYVPVDGAYLAL
ncbi:NAD(P)-dependent dehydrogenase (short-subunit alcohol dehydrogenase family) [Chitinophaga skermanii]|uniref:NAD(P)-dependent dehydrogenase (Short-subunit alcohol dehydrogenase family) n=1 Tax=Chitinophaga skermanii TaxID=331697 RepID=A0A327QEH4_9BACT|nr:glucose 1-dehydrogenase [Chitinophaga skermanii]RAJ01673.1 NAD(P)-dependent dehydrogenase (short-subunit alcohol dehydrogenase family) [Chitinophaga skermanii]